MEGNELQASELGLDPLAAMYPKSTNTDIKLTKAACEMKTRPSLVPKVKEPRVSGPLGSNGSDMSVSASGQCEDQRR